MRRRRAGLSTTALDGAERRLADHLDRLIAPCSLVAGYLAIDGEMPLGLTLSRCRSRGARTVLPVLDGRSMGFVEITDETPLVTRRFGLVEPAHGEPVDPMSLDAVLLPLVAFDACGNRLGMGGGFYDRCFAPVAGRRAAGLPTPRLIGVAHALQRVDALRPESWDVPLDQVVTEAGAVLARNIR